MADFRGELNSYKGLIITLNPNQVVRGFQEQAGTALQLLPMGQPLPASCALFPSVPEILNAAYVVVAGLNFADRGTGAARLPLYHEISTGSVNGSADLQAPTVEVA